MKVSYYLRNKLLITREIMNIKLKPIAIILAAMLASPSLIAQTKPTDSSNSKPMVIDAAVTDNRYQLYEGEVVKVDAKTRTITFKNMEGES